MRILQSRKMSQYCLLSYSTHAMSASGLGDPKDPCEVTKSWPMDIARRLRFHVLSARSVERNSPPSPMPEFTSSVSHVHGQSLAIPDPSFTARPEQPRPKSVCAPVVSSTASNCLWLFLTDDQKRKKAPEGTASALTSISERDEPTISLEQRLKDLEIVTNYHDIALRSLEAWSTTAFLMDPDTEPAPILIKALSTYNETRIESGPHPMGPPRRILAKAPGQWLHSQLPSDGPFAKYHATLTNPEDLEQRSVHLLVARKTKKGDKFLLRIRPHTSAVPAWNEAFQMLTHWVRQQPNGEVNSSRHRSPSHCADRETPRNSESPTFSQVLFFLPLRESGSTETAVRMSLRWVALNGRCSVQ